MNKQLFAINASARRESRRRIAGMAVVLLALFSWVVETPAAEPNFVGDLGASINKDVVKILGLDEEVREELAALVARRQQEGKRLLADVSEEDKPELLARFRQESEQLGQELLSLKQRETLIQFVLARDGLATLGRPDVGEILALSDEQRRRITSLLAEREETLSNASAILRQIAVGRYERKLQSLLTPVQLSRWEKMAGLSDTQPVEEPPKPAVAVPIEQGPPAATPQGKAELTFAFESTPWRTVLDWLAEKAELSLYLNALPTGGLTYSDRQSYTPDQAIERINRFLIPLGYTLLRSGKMISVISLDDGRREQMLEALAEYADLEDLETRGDSEVVKCIFTIAKADPNEVLAEISGLIKLSKPLLLAKSKQLIVIDTASKLKMIRRVLESMENPSLDQGPVRRFELKHIRANAVIDAVRPLVGIDDESSNIGADISLSMDPDGKRLFATGNASRLAIVEGMVALLDQEPSQRGTDDKLTLKAHLVEGGNLQAVDDVLQTLLADENVRLAQEPKTGRLIAFGNAEVHRRIEETIAQLQGEESVFESIQLKDVEPYVAIGVIREMFDIPYFIDDEDEDQKQDYPRVDYDTFTMRIFVRGTKSQVDEIKEVVAALEKPKKATSGPLRLLPIRGTRAQKLLETAKRFWPGKSEVLLFPPSLDEPTGVMEREISPSPSTPVPSPPPVSPNVDTTQVTPLDDSFVGAAPRQPPTLGPDPITPDKGSPPAPPSGPLGQATGPPIKAQVTARGILMHSDDEELLSRFEEHLRMIAGPGEFSTSRMAIFYLKHVRAVEAKVLLSDIRRGKSSFGRDVEEEDDDTTGPPRRRRFSSFSAPSVIADARLNRLIVQGTLSEIVEIEQNLKIIDRDRSITDVSIWGKPRIIPLVHIRASQAATVIREAYAGQLAKGQAAPNQTKQQQQQQQQQQLAQLLQQQQQQQPQNQGPQRAGQRPNQPNGQQQGVRNQRPQANQPQKQQPKTPSRSSQGQESTTQEPRMSLAVNDVSNTLIIRAPDQLFQEVSELVALIDKNATQSTRVITIHGLNPNYINDALRALFKQQPATRPTKTTPVPAQPAPAPVIRTQFQPTTLVAPGR